MRKWDNYTSSLSVLETASSQDLDNEFVQGGIINKFSMQFELGWKLMKVLVGWEGDPVSATGSPRDIIKAAYQYYDFMNEDVWLDMLRDRNNVAHVYDETAARRLVADIIECYVPEFQRLREGLQERYGELLDGPDF